MLRRILKRNATSESPRRTLPPKAQSVEELRERTAAYGTWMYRFDLGNGVSTTSHHEYLDDNHRSRWAMIEPELRATFDGRWPSVRALDIACNEGWWSVQAAKLGAGEVIGFDAREFCIERAEFVQAQLGLENVEFRVGNIHKLDLRQYGQFDVVFCLGLIYHLEDPMGAIRQLRALTRELCVIETEVARPTTITIDRGPADGLLTTDEAFVFMPEPEYKWNPLASVTGAAVVPTLAALKAMLTLAGFTDIRQAEPPGDAAERYTTGDRVVLFARYE